MGVIADFIVATEQEALEYSRSQSGIPSADLVESKGISAVELSTLLAILNGDEWREEMLDLFTFVPESEYLTLVSDKLLNRLTDFDYDLNLVSADWAATEEMGWDADEARMLIDELTQLAVTAKRRGKPIYLWNCV